MKENPATPLRLIESFYDPESGKTFVRHPHKEDEWLDSLLLKDVMSGCPVYSATGNSQCEVFTSVPHGEERKKGTKMVLMLTMMSRRHHEK